MDFVEIVKELGLPGLLVLIVFKLGNTFLNKHMQTMDVFAQTQVEIVKTLRALRLDIDELKRR